MRLEFSDGTRLFCRGCQAESPHAARGEYAVCQHCGRKMLGAEVVVTWSYDDLDKPHMFMPPVRLLTPGERFNRFVKAQQPAGPPRRSFDLSLDEREVLAS
jgi:DNA-directed RNA polymerase subunit RPC12/RpoP